MLGRVERAAKGLEPSITSTLNGPTDVSSRSRPSSREAPHDAVLVAAAHQREGVVHTEVRVLAHADDEEQLVGARVAVEVVAVVEVAIARAGCRTGWAIWWIGRSSRGDSIGGLLGALVEHLLEQAGAGLVEGPLGGAREDARWSSSVITRTMIEA